MALRGCLRVWQLQVHETQVRRKLGRVLLMHSEWKMQAEYFSFWLRQRARVENIPECIGCTGLSTWITQFRIKVSVRSAFEALVRTAQRSLYSRRRADTLVQRYKLETLRCGLITWSGSIRISKKESAFLKNRIESLKSAMLGEWYHVTCAKGQNDKKLLLFYGLSLEDIARQRVDLFMQQLRQDICACLNILEFYVDIEVHDIDGAVVTVTLHSVSQRSVSGLDLFESLWAKLSDPWSDLRRRPSTSELICVKTNAEFTQFLNARLCSMTQRRSRHKVLAATIFFSWRGLTNLNAGLRGMLSACSLIARRRLVHCRLKKWRGHVRTTRKQLRFFVRHQNQRLHSIIVQWSASSHYRQKVLRCTAHFWQRRMRTIWTEWRTRQKQSRFLVHFLVRHQNQRLHAIIVQWSASSHYRQKALRCTALFWQRRMRTIWTGWRTRQKQSRFLVRFLALHQNQRLHAIIVQWSASSHYRQKALRCTALFWQRRMRTIWTEWRTRQKQSRFLVLHQNQRLHAIIDQWKCLRYPSLPALPAALFVLVLLLPGLSFFVVAALRCVHLCSWECPFRENMQLAGALEPSTDACFVPDRVLALRKLRQMVKTWRMYYYKAQKTRAVIMWHTVLYPRPGPSCLHVLSSQPCCNAS
jgi:hypothetical protein